MRRHGAEDLLNHVRRVFGLESAAPAPAVDEGAVELDVPPPTFRVVSFQMVHKTR